MKIKGQILIAVTFTWLAACASHISQVPLNVQDIMNSGDSYVGKFVSVKGFIALDDLKAPHFYQSKESADSKNDVAAIDVTSDDARIYESLKGAAPGCIIISGDYHNNSDSIHTGYSKVGLIRVRTFKQC